MRSFSYFYCLLAGLLAGAATARAQDSTAVAPPAAVAASAPAPAPPDTAAALHRLFVAQRSLRTTAVGGTLAVSGVAIGLILVNDSPGGSYDLAPLGAALIGLVTVPVVLAELGHFGKHYSRRQERRAIAALQAHHLDAALKEKLTARYFQPTPP